MAIRVRNLVKDVHDFHGGVPSHIGWDVGNFKRVIDVVIEDSETGAFNVLVRLVIVALPDESGVDSSLLSTAEGRLARDGWWIYRLRAWAVREAKRDGVQQHV